MDGARGRREAIRQLADLRRRLAAAEEALADALAAMKQAEGAFDAAEDRFGDAERALDAAREERAQARRERYTARQAYERASATADRLARRLAEMAERLERMQLRVLTWRGVAVPVPDGLGIVVIPALPRQAAGRLIRQDHAVPARCPWLGDPLNDPALPPPAADADRHGHVLGISAVEVQMNLGPRGRWKRGHARRRERSDQPWLVTHSQPSPATWT